MTGPARGEAAAGPPIPGAVVRTVAVNGVALQVTEAGEGPLVVLAHGFPELARSWRHQIPALAAAGYHVVAPDQRGYGGSSRPEGVTDYDIEHLVGDLLGLADEAGAERAVFVGHDWGSMVVWSLAQRHPERVAGVMGMSVPFLARPSRPPTEIFRFLFGENFFYMRYFQEPGVADADLGRDPATTMRRFLAGLSAGNGGGSLGELVTLADGRGMVERLPEPDALPDWLSPAELDAYVEAFARSGFTGGINWYRNLDRNWELGATLPDRIDVPAAFVAGASDPVLVMTPYQGMEARIPDLRAVTIVDGAGHWVQQEKPDEVTDALLAFLGGLDLR
jgi:pimeloyl-ACP methyl ester carboxylesterase